MQNVTIELTGRRPLLMSSARLANPLDPLTKEKKKLTSKRTKTDADHEAMAHIEFVAGIYTNGHGPFVPAVNLERCLLDAAKITRQGQQVKRGVIVEDDADLTYEGPRDTEALWNGGYYLLAPVGVNQKKTMRCRPMFREWAVTFAAILDPEIIDLADFQSIADRAGRLIGLGDWRPRYGRFAAKVTS